MTTTSVLIVGGGEIGTAIARVIGNRAPVVTWDRDTEHAPGMRLLEECAPEADILFLCVPSWAVREVLGRVASGLRADALVVSLAKGIEQDTLATMDAVLHECLPNGQPFAVLGGPLLAEELMAGLPGVGVFASASVDAFDRVAPLFDGSRVRLERSDDAHAVALVAVLKNVYAVGLGVADGLGWGWNAKGWLAARAIAEMSEILSALNGEPAVAFGSAGAGDFLATAMSPDSRNRETGREIARQGTCANPSEGCRSLPLVLSLLDGRTKDLPFLLCLDRIINGHDHPKEAFERTFAAR